MVLALRPFFVCRLLGLRSVGWLQSAADTPPKLARPTYRVLIAQDQAEFRRSRSSMLTGTRSSGRVLPVRRSHGPRHPALAQRQHPLPTDNVTIVEMTPDKKVVWKHVSKPRKATKGQIEIHAFQRLADGLTMVAETGNKRIIEVDAEDKVVKEIPGCRPPELAPRHPPSPQARQRPLPGLPRARRDRPRVRRRGQGHLELQARPRRSSRHPRPRRARDRGLQRDPPPDGNTIIAGGNNNRVFEVNPEGKVVWSIEHDELPGIKLAWVTSLQLRPNGNLIFGNTHAGPPTRS